MKASHCIRTPPTVLGGGSCEISLSLLLISTVCIHERINTLRCACITAQDFYTHVQATCKHGDFKERGWQVEKTCQALAKTELPSWPSVMCRSSKHLVKKTDFICRGIKFIIGIFQLYLSRALIGSVSWSYCLNNTLIVNFLCISMLPHCLQIKLLHFIAGQEVCSEAYFVNCVPHQQSRGAPSCSRCRTTIYYLQFRR